MVTHFWAFLVDPSLGLHDVRDTPSHACLRFVRGRVGDSMGVVELNGLTQDEAVQSCSLRIARLRGQRDMAPVRGLPG